MSPHYKSITLYERSVNAMIGTICILSLVYCAILLSLVFSVIERKQSILESRDLTSQLSTLEANYANKIASINDSSLNAHQFVRVDGATLTVRKDAIASYTVLYAR